MEVSPIIDAALEATEAGLDTMLESELLKSIPVVGTTLKLIKGAGQIRDRLFVAKLIRFLRKLDEVTPGMKEEVRKQVAKSSKESHKVGETVVLLLDRLSDLDKAELIAVLFIAYTYGHIKAEDFQRLGQAIDIAFIGDVHEFIANGHNLGRKEPANSGYMQALLPSGISEVVGGTQINQIGKIYFTPSSLGKKLVNAYAQGTKLCQPESGAYSGI